MLACSNAARAFIGGSVPVQTGMTRVGIPGAAEGWKKVDTIMATVLGAQGYASGQFGKNLRGGSSTATAWWNTMPWSASH